MAKRTTRATAAPAPPDPPATLDDAAKRRWREVIPGLAARGAVDLETLATYCQVWSRWRKAEDTLTKTGPLVKTPRGGAAPSPMLSVSKQSHAQVVALETRLGIGVDAPPAEDLDDAALPPARRKRPGLFTRPELAEAFAVHQQTITKWERDGLPIEVRGTRGRPSLYSLAACVQWRVERELQARGIDADALSPQNERALLDRKRREDLELKMRVRAGELVEMEAVRTVFADLATAVKARLRAIPDAIADQLTAAAHAGPNPVKTLLLDRIDDALRELSRGVHVEQASVDEPQETAVA